jgi:hypothetical protein
MNIVISAWLENWRLDQDANADDEWDDDPYDD